MYKKVSILHWRGAPIDINSGGLEHYSLNIFRKLNSIGVSTRLYASGFSHQQKNFIKLYCRHKPIMLMKEDLRGDLAYAEKFLKKVSSEDVLYGINMSLLGALVPERSVVRFGNILPLAHFGSKEAMDNYAKTTFIFVSNYIRSVFLKYYPEIPSRNCITVYNGVDCNRFAPASSKKFNRSPIKVLFCSQWSRSKGIYLFLEAAKCLEKKVKNVQFCLAGSVKLWNFELSKKGREMLDSEGLDYVKIVASNQLDEYVIKSLMEQSAPIDVFGVGTALVTGMGAGALDGVYKLCQINGKQTLKISDNITKITLPGKKSSYRFRDDKGMFTADGIALDEETDFDIIHHPFEAGKSSNISGCKQEQLIHKVMNKGRKESGKKSPGKISEYAQSRLQFLPGEQKRFMNPHIYKVGISSQLLELRQKMTGKAIHK